ncbi:MAG: reprolysin-like metallopeptidase [Ginsengibacter sp.]
MKKNLLSFLFCLSVTFVSAQQKNYWTPTNESQASKGQDLFANEFKPARYTLYQLKENLLRNDIAGAPLEKTVKVSSSNFIISVPNAEGKIERFRIVEAPVMQAKLAAKYPNLKSFAGRGIEDPSATIRFDITPAGFHAMVTSAKNPTFYINPLNQKEGIYIVNSRNENDKSSFRCELDDTFNSIQGTDKKTPLAGNADDDSLRIFRLALCVNGEYSRVFLSPADSTDTSVAIGKVMASLVTNLTRANQVYERDYGVRMVFVDNEDSLIYLDPATDPWPVATNSKWNSETQKTIDKRIGKSNYDIGHLLGKVAKFSDNNGNAGCIACVCTSGQKGSGFTAYNDPTLIDYMVIDYWTHEMGHQFGANHTFTYRDEGSGANVEPGSGSTIMGYAGITGSTDVQPHSDDYFHAVSIAQVTNYIKSKAGGCSVNSATGNATPVVSAGKDYIIPANTPFQLTGTATDMDATDLLSYTWEQIDIYEKGANTLPKPTSKKGPLFRSINYSTNQTRVFPNLETILSGKKANKWEALPSVSREMNFRFTARDNHPGGGSNKSDDSKVSVDTSGPFIITSLKENSKIVWSGGEKKTITWDVANTNKLPVNCAKVNVLLSLNGGVDFTTTLVAATDNDGEVEITVPKVNTEKARIKIEAVDNIFFDISNADFSINYVLPVTWLTFTAEAKSNNVLLNWSVANETNNDHFGVQHSTDGQKYTEVGSVKSKGNSSQMQAYDFTDYNAVSGINYYRLEQVDVDGRRSYSAIATVVLSANGNAWKIQPNPATDKAILKAGEKLSNVNIQLIDLSGKIVYSLQKSKVEAGESITIPLNQLTKGMYIIKMNSKELNTSDKLIVQ